MKRGWVGDWKIVVWKSGQGNAANEDVNANQDSDSMALQGVRVITGHTLFASICGAIVTQGELAQVLKAHDPQSGGHGPSNSPCARGDDGLDAELARPMPQREYDLQMP